MSFRGSFSWFNSLHQGGKRAISFTLTCSNMFQRETFDCAIIDSTGQTPTQIRRQLKLKPNESFTFNYDTCGWNWCQGDYFAILEKKDKIKKRWDLELKIYGRGECPECHGSHRCIKCNGNGTITDHRTHTVLKCKTCNGTGFCQKCYVPIRGADPLSNEVYGNGSLPNVDANRQRKIAALQRTISDLQAKIEKVDWDARMMQRKGTDVSLHMVYSSHIELKHQYERQLLNAQHELQQLESISSTI